VDAPEGTEALADTPFSNSAQTRMVGFPLESSISKAFTEDIFDISILLESNERPQNNPAT
jgi:hypothetical protein